MYSILVTLHVIVAVLLVLVVLLQAGRSGGLSGLMGGGGGDALFSTSSQQSGLRKGTIIIAILFMCTSLGLTILSSRRSGDSLFNRTSPVPMPGSQPIPVFPPGDSAESPAEAAGPGAQAE